MFTKLTCKAPILESATVPAKLYWLQYYYWPAYSLCYSDECFTWWPICSLLAYYQRMKIFFSYHESWLAYAVDQDEQEVCWIENRLGEICFCVGMEEEESLSPSICEDSAAACCLAASSTYWRSSILVIKLKARLSITLE